MNRKTSMLDTLGRIFNDCRSMLSLRTPVSVTSLPPDLPSLLIFYPKKIDIWDFSSVCTVCFRFATIRTRARQAPLTHVSAACFGRCIKHANLACTSLLWSLFTPQTSGSDGTSPHLLTNLMGSPEKIMWRGREQLHRIANSVKAA